MPPIYLDPKSGQSIVTHSMIKTFRRCAKQAEYKYIRRLKPRRVSKPLDRGVWIHRLLEIYYGALLNLEGAALERARPEARRLMWAEHKLLSLKFEEKFDEEKEELGDLPTEIRRIMEGYFYHYRNHDWVVRAVEFVLETPFPDGTIYRCRIDLLVEDQFGLWIVDHKSHKRLPDLTYRILDAQSGLYVWCAIRNGLPVQGHIWNYIKTKAPTVPAVVYKGTRLSKSAIETDYLTLGRTIKAAGLRLSDYRVWLSTLKSHQYAHGEPQLSPFFRRDILEKSPALLKRVAQEGLHTAKRMNDYPWDKTDYVERVVDRSCVFMCSYTDLCTAELFMGPSGLTRNLLKQRFTIGDPLDYYNDDRGEFDKGGGSE